ncbi:MAG: SDR family oxidoreductase [Clostridiaceae bacterium]
MNKVAIITGASKGIGSTIAKRLAKEGIYVVINYLKNKDLAQAVKEEINSMGVYADIFCADVSNFEEAKALVNHTIEKCGRLDILVNNAGISYHGLLLDMNEEDYDKLMDINLKGAFNMTRHALPHLLKTQGSILNMSSIWSEAGASNEVVYSMTKAGINMFTKSLAKEVATSGVRVNSIAPGLIDTDMNNNLSETEKNEITSYLASKRIGTTMDIANLAAFLLSDDAQYINGQIITVDGGYI